MLDISDCAYEDFICELGHQEWFEYATMVEHQPNLQCMGSTNTYPKEKQSVAHVGIWSLSTNYKLHSHSNENLDVLI